MLGGGHQSCHWGVVVGYLYSWVKTRCVEFGGSFINQPTSEMTSQNCNLIVYSTHVASNFIKRGIKNSQKSYVHYFHKDFPQFNNNYS